MKYPVNLQIESTTIGTSPRTVAEPSRPGQVIFRTFDVTCAQPLAGAITIGDFVEALEKDQDMAPRLAKARRLLADTIDGDVSLRRLRLANGLSQEKLADRANTTQAYVARVESGTLDPGTDMLARLATALGSDDVTVFSAIRAQRTRKQD